MKGLPSQVTIVGAGLAGSEAALTAARFGVPVTLIEMKPGERTPAHSLALFAELVCSNSLKSDRPETAQGLLKRELRALGCRLLQLAEDTSVPAGGSLAVDRGRFAAAVTGEITAHPLITVIEERIDSLDRLAEREGPAIIATGPLTSGGLYESIRQFTGSEGLHFFDAVAPIVDALSIDRTQTFLASRYGKGGADYLNCPLSKEEYKVFREALISAEKVAVRDFDSLYFKDCLPIEALAERGEDAMRFGPLRPVGLTDPATGTRPYACLQLRKEAASGSMWSLVGCQTRLTFAEQRRAFGLIPALRQAEYLRYGVMHRNSFLNGPRVLGPGFQSRQDPTLFFAGQLTGLEGYVEAIMSGLVAGVQTAAIVRGASLQDRRELLPSGQTMMGALAAWVTEAGPASFQPMNANFGLLPLPGARVKKNERAPLRISRSDAGIGMLLQKLDILFHEGPDRHDL